MHTPALLERLQRSGVVAVVTVEEAAQAVPVAQALLDGGIDVIELTLRTDAAVEAIRRIRREVPGVLVGAGTVLTRTQVKAVKRAGAAFGVAPGCSVDTLRAAHDLGLPFAPGVMTPSDIENAVAHGCRLAKYFPAESSGGLAHLASMATPFAHLGLRYIPLGGITVANLAGYLASPLIAAVGGSWLAKPEQIRAAQWKVIHRQAAEAARMVREVRCRAALSPEPNVRSRPKV